MGSEWSDERFLNAQDDTIGTAETWTDDSWEDDSVGQAVMERRTGYVARRDIEKYLEWKELRSHLQDFEISE